VTAKGIKMKRYFTLEYWKDDGWFVGKLKEVPGVFSQGATLEELRDNIVDAYHLMLEQENIEAEHPDIMYTELGIEV
jgi:predicted RNase H-like HicB family nuclease